MADTVEDFDNFRDLTGRVIADRYTLTRFISSGGFGAVYEASDIRLPAKRLAIKLCLQISSERSFLREAQLLGQLNHDNIVRVSDQGVHKGIPYIVMDLLVGESAGELLRRHQGRMPQSLMLKFVRDVGRALAHAHEHQLVHRDLKPNNVMYITIGHRDESMRDSKFVLYDFGIASKTNAQNSLANKTFAGAGTPEYMAPEQVKSQEPTERTDIYSFGVVLYEMLTGQVPFPVLGESQLSIARVMNDIVETPPPSLSKIAPEAGIPEQVEKLILKCLEKKPGDRPQSISDVYSEFLSAYEVRPDTGVFSNTILPAANGSAETSAPVSTRRSRTTTLPVNHVIPLVLVLAVIFSIAGAAAAVFLYARYSSGTQANRLQIALSDEQLRVNAGETAKLSLMLKRDSPTRKVILSVTGGPQGVQFEFPKTSDADLVNVVISVSPQTAAGESTVTFLCSGQGEDSKLSAETSLKLAILAPAKPSEPAREVAAVTPVPPVKVPEVEMPGKAASSPGDNVPAESIPVPPLGKPVDREFVHGVSLRAAEVCRQVAVFARQRLAELEQVRFVPEIYQVDLNSQTPEAVVTILQVPAAGEGEPRITRPGRKMPASARLTAGDYLVRVEANYFEPKEESLRLGEGSTSQVVIAVDLLPRVAHLPVSVSGEKLLDDCRAEAPALNPEYFRVTRLDNGCWQVDCYEFLLKDHADQQIRLRGTTRNCFPAEKRLSLRELLSSKELPLGDLKAVTGVTAGETWTLEPGGVDLSFVWCPPGEFVRDTSKIQIGPGKKGERTPVQVTEGFWIGKYEVTQAQWKFLPESPEIPEIVEARANPFLPIKVASLELNDALPVANVNWQECTDYCRNLTAHGHALALIPDDWEFRLPLEDEWEYACRSTTTTDYAFGDTLPTGSVNIGGVRPRLVKGGEFPPNKWGIFDMHGNVEEWCADDHTGMAKVRGGHWRSNNVESARSSATGYLTADLRQAMTGLRVVLAPIRKQVPRDAVQEKPAP